MVNNEANPVPASAPEEGANSTVAFCQQCGRPLSVATVRPVGSGIFCEPCAAMHQGPPRDKASAGPSAGGYRPVNTGPGRPGSFPPPLGAPNPVLAGFLGLIPGVGAMYNGQYPKGVIHLVIFVVLTSLADNLNWVLWWFVWGWIFYQAFEAYHTAQARRDGLPLPDPFGWNDLGDRLGFSRTSQPTTPPPNPVHSAGPSHPGPASPPPPASQGGYAATDSPVSPDSLFSMVSSPASATAGSSSTAPYIASAGAPLPPISDTLPPFSPAPETPAPDRPASFPPNGVPPAAQYGPIYTGTKAVEDATLSSIPQNAAQRFPAGAAWLIGLGLLFLLANLAPAWHFQGRWLVPALLAALALWTGGQRLADESLGSSSRSVATLAEGLLGPALLLTVAALLALQAADIIPLRHSWPAFLIVWGVMLFLSRSDPPNASPPANG